MSARALAVSSLVLILATSGATGSGLERIRPSSDGSHFVYEGSERRASIWGFNYDRDDSGRLLEDYWADEWATVADDFRGMKALGGNVVRVHLQLGRFMKGVDQPDAENLARLGRLVGLAEETGLYLDVTGLGCYHKQDVPAWYDALDEPARWGVQARFMDRSKLWVDGWISFYWGKTIEQNEAKGDVNGALVAGWLKRFGAMAPDRQGGAK